MFRRSKSDRSDRCIGGLETTGGPSTIARELHGRASSRVRCSDGRVLRRDARGAARGLRALGEAERYGPTRIRALAIARRPGDLPADDRRPDDGGSGTRRSGRRRTGTRDRHRARDTRPRSSRGWRAEVVTVERIDASSSGEPPSEAARPTGATRTCTALAAGRASSACPASSHPSMRFWSRRRHPRIPPPLTRTARRGREDRDPRRASPGLQQLLIVAKRARTGSGTRRSLGACRFVPLLGGARPSRELRPVLGSARICRHRGTPGGEGRFALYCRVPCQPGRPRTGSGGSQTRLKGRVNTSA